MMIFDFFILMIIINIIIILLSSSSSSFFLSGIETPDRNGQYPNFLGPFFTRTILKGLDR